MLQTTFQIQGNMHGNKHKNTRGQNNQSMHTTMSMRRCIALTFQKLTPSTKNKRVAWGECLERSLFRGHHWRRDPFSGWWRPSLLDPRDPSFRNAFLQKRKRRLNHPKRTKRSRESITANPCCRTCKDDNTILRAFPEMQRLKTHNVWNHKIRESQNEA